LGDDGRNRRNSICTPCLSPGQLTPECLTTPVRLSEVRPMSDSPRNHPTLDARELANMRLQMVRENAEAILRRVGDAPKGTNADLRLLALGQLEIVRLVEALVLSEPHAK
jgi:hypothetical protein